MTVPLAGPDELWRRTFDAMRDGVSVHTPDGVILRANAALGDLVGQPAGELIGRRCYEVVHRATEFIAGCPMRESCTSGGAGYAEFQAPDGERWFDVSTAPLRDENGVVTEIVHVVRDITDRRQYEDDLWRASSDWRATFDAVRDIILLLRPDGRVIKGNRAAAQFFRCEVQFLTNRFLPALLKIRGLPGDFFTPAAGAPPGPQGEREIRLPGEDLWYSVVLDTVAPEKNVGLGGTVLIAHDISAVKHADQGRQNLKAQLFRAQKMESIGRIAGGVAHDFNNLMSAVMGYSELAYLKLPEGHPVREKLQIIFDAGERASVLTRQLLAFSRKQVLEVRPVRIPELLRHTSRMLDRVLGEDIAIEIDAYGEAAVLADQGQLEQVIMNLAINARDAMPGGGRLRLGAREVTLEDGAGTGVGAAPPGCYVQLEVADTGQGIPKELQEKIFEPFFTTKEAGKGTGLGLATVYGIVTQHGGYISLESEPGRGTTFTILLPRIDKAAATAPSPPPEPLLGGCETILVVEDDESLRRYVLDVLSPLGYRVLDAATAETAAELAADCDGPIHLLLSDIVLPGMRGWELSRVLGERHPGMKVLYMSGYAEEYVTGEWKLEPGTRLLKKPFTPGVLTGTLREVLAP